MTFLQMKNELSLFNRSPLHCNSFADSVIPQCTLSIVWLGLPAVQIAATGKDRETRVVKRLKREFVGTIVQPCSMRQNLLHHLAERTMSDEHKSSQDAFEQVKSQCGFP